MQMFNSHSLRRLSTARAPKIAKKCCPMVIERNFKYVLLFLISSFQLYIDTHIYISFNVPHLIEK